MASSRCIVIGGGIGGLAAALALLRAGADAQVFEQAPVLGEVGAGLTLSRGAIASGVAPQPGAGRGFCLLALQNRRPPAHAARPAEQTGRGAA